LDKPLFEPKIKPVKKAKEPRKRKISPESEQRDPEEPASKRSEGSNSGALPDGGPRRSARHAGKVLDYSKELQDKLPRSAALTSGIKSFENEGPQGQGGKRTQNPSVFLSLKVDLELIHIVGKDMGIFLASKLGHGGQLEKSVAMMLFMRT
jgi:E3 ubiquitin-protein ligase UHRF1